MDKEKKAFKNIKTKDDLDNYIESFYLPGKHNCILVDEVQQIERFEESTGRYVEIRVHPLTYPEFLEFHSLEDSDESLMKYLNYGGLPGLRQIGLDSDEHVWAYLSSVFNTIMLKDIIEHHDIRNVPFLNNLIAFYADTTGKLTSANSISKYMKSQGKNISSNLVL
ncbi:MAG: ATPase, partial [Prevotellaceae bacterium]|nr:ATPase [Prevotellaceae bacterium]